MIAGRGSSLSHDSLVPRRDRPVGVPEVRGFSAGQSRRLEWDWGRGVREGGWSLTKHWKLNADRFLSELVGREALLREYIGQWDSQTPRVLPATLRKTLDRCLSIYRATAGTFA